MNKLDEIAESLKGGRARSLRGRTVLLVGPAGSGKTMAAHAIAEELGRELFAVDLARVVSKYIGETEENLARAFDEAERAGAVLFFDEADALFGKRTGVKDSHDRYANLEIALLRQMEAYRGPMIFTAKKRADLDPAFLRRLRFVVSFPPRA